MTKPQHGNKQLCFKAAGGQGEVWTAITVWQQAISSDKSSAFVDGLLGCLPFPEHANRPRACLDASQGES